MPTASPRSTRASFGPEGVSRLSNRARLAAVAATGLVDGPTRDALDRLTRLAARLLGVPTALVSLVDSERQFFASAVGLSEPWASLRGTPLSHSFCQYVVQSDAPLVVESAPSHPVVCDSRAIDDLGIIAYAGIPLRTAQGHVLGSFCAIDTQPRHWSEEDLETLRDLSLAVVAEIELGMMANALASVSSELRSLLDETTELVCAADAEGRITFANQAWLDTLGYALDDAIGKPAIELVAAEDRARYVDAGRRLHTGEAVPDFEAVLIAADGRRVTCRGRARPEMVDDPSAPGGRRCLRTHAAYRDVSAERQVEADRARLLRERDVADKALRESEARTREAIEASLDAMFILRAVRSPESNISDLKIADCNREAQLLIRARRADIVGRSASAVFREARKRGLLDVCARVVETGDAFTSEYRIHTHDAPFSWAWLQIVRVGDGVAITARDITAQKASEDSLRALALVDDLTGVANRRGFLAAAERECQRAIREHRSALLAYIDVNDFKEINDTHGHSEGDEALRAIGKVLRAAFRGADVIGRVGGDEFAVLVLPTNFQSPADESDRRVHDLLAHIEDGIRHRIVYQLAKANAAAAASGRNYEISLSVGVASVSDMSGESMSASASLAAMMADADERLYDAKRARREGKRVP
ncbi:MAG TPA: diguanylate cyclase [Casimicrobiaceae bacterium]|nr:diguanylate cyclase [Casimicrobiaceae bacterium]